MMFRNLMLGLLMFVGAIAHAQPFEGKLVYVLDFELGESAQKMGLTKEVLLEKMKEEGTDFGLMNIWYSASGFYRKEMVDANKGEYVIYRPDSNAIFTFTGTDDIIAVNDAGVASGTGMGLDVKDDWTLLDTLVSINGKQCKILVNNSATGKATYYFAEGYLPVDVAFFKGHVTDGWADYIDRAGHLPIKIDCEVNGFMSTSQTLVSADEMNTDLQMFYVPALEPSKQMKDMESLSNLLDIRYMEPIKGKSKK